MAFSARFKQAEQAQADQMVKVSINLQESILDEYGAQAGGSKDLERVLAQRLTACVGYVASKPIYLDDEDRRQLDKLLAVNLTTPAELIKAVEKLTTLKVGEVGVSLPPRLLERLKSRCFEKDYGVWLAKLTVKLLEEFAMMR